MYNNAEQNPSTYLYTWRNNKIQSRLDIIYCTKNTIIKKTRKVAVIFSDHDMYKTEIQMDTVLKRRNKDVDRGKTTVP